MRIIVIGGSAAGLSAALLLARAGHQAEVLDQDALVPAPDIETAARTAFRPAAPQLVQLHQLIPLGRLLLRDHLPDVYALLLTVGAVESPVSDRMPLTMTNRSPRTDDDDLTSLQVRRSTIDWVLRTIAADEPGIELRGETRVTGLVVRAGDPPRVVGVHTAQGDRKADIVIDASGRRSPLDSWLDDVHARPAERRETECGLSYYTRHYRPRRGATWPQPGRLSTLSFTPHFGLVACTADNDVLSVAICPATEDIPLRALRHETGYEAALATQPMLREWRAAGRPVSAVQPMAGLRGLLRRLVVDQAPVALGLHVIGDATCHMNPTLGRGVGMAVHSALRVTDAIRHHPDASDQAVAVDAAVTDDVEPWFAEQSRLDAAYLGTLRRTMRGEPPLAPDPDGDVSPVHIRAAAAYDPEVFRSLMSVVGMLRRPDSVDQDPQVRARTRGVLAALDRPAPDPLSRRALLDTLTSP